MTYVHTYMLYTALFSPQQKIYQQETPAWASRAVQSRDREETEAEEGGRPWRRWTRSRSYCLQTSVPSPSPQLPASCSPNGKPCRFFNTSFCLPTLSLHSSSIHRWKHPVQYITFITCSARDCLAPFKTHRCHAFHLSLIFLTRMPVLTLHIPAYCTWERKIYMVNPGG